MRRGCFIWICNWTLTLREEDRLRVFEKSVCRRIFGRKRAEVAGGWKELLTESVKQTKTKLISAFFTPLNSSV
jgi:hypothetical protein